MVNQKEKGGEEIQSTRKPKPETSSIKTSLLQHALTQADLHDYL